MTKTSLPVLITLALSKIVRVHEGQTLAGQQANPRREEKVKAAALAALPSFRMSGQTDPGMGIVLEEDEKGRPTKVRALKGNVRDVALEMLAAEGAIDPRTGKVFATMDMLVYPKDSLTEQEQYILIHDHSDVTDLDKFETYRSVCQGWAQGFNDEQIMAKHGTLIERNFTNGDSSIPKATVKDANGNMVEQIDYKKWKEKKYGVLQNMKRIRTGPTVLRIEAEKQLKGEDKKWLKISEITKLVKVFTDEVAAADKGELGGKGIMPGTLTPDNPGPAFLEAWKIKLQNVADTAAEGGKIRSTAMLNNETQTTIKNAALSRTVKLIFRVSLNEISRDILADLQAALLAKFESNPDVQALLTKCENYKEPAAPTGK